MDSQLLSKIESVAQIAARKGAAELMELFGNVTIREKGPRDLVTQADVASQNAIEASVKREFPDHIFVGEEVVDSDSLSVDHIRSLHNDEICWIVDPLDGTTNYAHQMPAFAVSIAVVQNGEVLCGVIYDPNLEEMYAAKRSAGATLNGAPIHASNARDLNSSLIVASFSTNVTTDSIEITRFNQMLVRCRAVRRLGSAALNMAYVAAGRMDGYWATSVKTWDVAGGYLIAKEAGVTITHFSGSPFDLWDPQITLAGTEELHQRMLEILLQE